MKEFTFIKEGKEEKSSELMQRLSRKGKVYSVDLDHLKRKEYQVAENVELLHFKKFDFRDAIRFVCQSKDTILILENCTFKNEVNFHQGNIVVSNPKFVLNFPNINFYHNDEVELILDDSKEENRYPLEKRYAMDSGVKSLTVTGNIKNSCITTLSSMEKVHLKNLTYRHGRNGAVCAMSSAENIKIENCNIEDFSLTYWCKNLEIKNSIIKAAHDITLTKPNVTLQNVALKSPRIVLATGEYKKEEELYFDSYDMEASGNRKLAETSLISSLKALAGKVERNCETEKEKLTTEVEKRYEERIEAYQGWLEYDISKRNYYERKVITDKKAIELVESEKSGIVNNIDKCLKRQKIKTLVMESKK